MTKYSCLTCAEPCQGGLCTECARARYEEWRWAKCSACGAPGIWIDGLCCLCSPLVDLLKWYEWENADEIQFFSLKQLMVGTIKVFERGCNEVGMVFVRANLTRIFRANAWILWFFDRWLAEREGWEFSGVEPDPMHAQAESVQRRHDEAISVQRRKTARPRLRRTVPAGLD